MCRYSRLIRWAVCLAVVANVVNCRPAAAAEEGAAKASSSQTEILNGDSILRIATGCRTPVVAGADGQVKFMADSKKKEPMKLVETAPPPAEWAKAEFDDSSWMRWTGSAGNPPAKDWMSSIQNNWLCARTAFVVDDPAKADSLKLVLEYRGGVVVCLNGVEVKRGNVPAGEIKPDSVAEKYQDEAYSENGTLVKESAKRLRKLEVEFAAKDLKKGVNVLAVMVLRAPLSEVALTSKGPKDPGREAAGSYFWPHMRLDSLRLTAAPGSAVQANCGRPAGVQVWPVQPLETITVEGYGEPSGKAAIRLTGVRNGVFSGRFAISSDAPLKGVKVVAGALAGENGASLPASALSVRYASQAGVDTGWMANGSRHGKMRFDILENTAPAEVPLAEGNPPAAGRSSPKPGAVLPVWVTVTVPADAKPGIYKGEVVASATGLAETRIPVSIKVNGWSLPNSDAYVGVNDFTLSHESVALVYKEPLWSDRHFELMGKSLELADKLASRFCYLNVLLEGHCMGNSEGMIRWIPKADGTYDYDFGPFDKYMDLFAKKVGKPRGIVVTVWVTSQQGWKAKVSKLDPATKKVESMDFPPYYKPESVGFWKPVMTEIRKKVEARGWWDVTLIGHTGDQVPKPAEVDCFKAIWPDGKWIFSAHMAYSYLEASDKSKVPVVVGERVWGCGRLYNPDGRDPVYGTTYPQRWNTTKEAIELVFPRYGQGAMHSLSDESRLALWRMTSEASIQGNLHGFGRVGLDFWPIPGRRRTHWDSLAGSSNQGMGHSVLAIVGAGKDGPAATERYEMCREGVQVREAIIYLQKALVEKKGGEAMAKRITDLLDERARQYLRTRIDQNNPVAWIMFEGGGWQDRDDQLFALCAEIAGSLK